jgi:5'/3'-nucleotidase SurE
MIGSFARALRELNGWDVRVVVPSSQKSWIGGAYQISGPSNGLRRLRRAPRADEPTDAGLMILQTRSTGRTTTPRDRPTRARSPRPRVRLRTARTPSGSFSTAYVPDRRELLRAARRGLTLPSHLLSQTPATCSNIGLHNLYPGEIDLVVSGPNNGRNTSAAFSLASGTIGATLGSTLAGVRSIALSYALFDRRFTPRSLELANVIACRVLASLCADWGKDGGLAGGNVGLYTVRLHVRLSQSRRSCP